MRVRDILEIARLTTPEKILLVEDLWDSIILDESSVPIPESHVEELERRLKSYKDHPEKLLSLKEIQIKIEAKK